MPPKQVTISARISVEDAEFISRLQVEDAKTPSDKLRAIITQAKESSSRPKDYTGSLNTIQDIIQPVLRNIRKTEVDNQIHSELVIRLAEWIPDTAAFLVSSILETDEPKTFEQMSQVEQGVADRAIRLIESVLQLAVTEHCDCYNPEILRQKISPVLELCQIILAKKF